MLARFDATPNPSIESWVPIDCTSGLGSLIVSTYRRDPFKLLASAQEMASKARIPYGWSASIDTLRPYRERVFETFSCTEKMRSSETLTDVISMGPVSTENTLISHVSSFLGVWHFPRRPYDGQIVCMWTKLCSRVSPDHLSLSLGDHRGSIEKLLTYIIHQK